MLRNAGLVVLSLAATLLLLEIALRIAGYSGMEPHRLAPTVGWEPIPGIQGTYRRVTEAEIEFNAHGFRGPERDPTGALFVTGDSFVEARELPWEQTFTGLLDAALPDTVVNAGVSGWGTAQSLLDFERRVAPRAPSTVLHFLFLGNDVSNNHRPLDGHGERPYFELDEAGALVRGEGWPEGTAFDAEAARKNLSTALSNMSRVVQFIRVQNFLLRHGGKIEDVARDLEVPGPSDGVLVPPAPGSDWDTAWRITEALLLAYRDAVEASGARFVLVVVGKSIQVHPDAGARADWATRLNLPDLDYPNTRLRAFATTNGIEMIDLVQPLRAAAEGEGIHLHGFPRVPPGHGHWNAAGHRVVADTILHYLLNR